MFSQLLHRIASAWNGTELKMQMPIDTEASLFSNRFIYICIEFLFLSVGHVWITTIASIESAKLNAFKIRSVQRLSSANWCSSRNCFRRPYCLDSLCFTTLFFFLVANFTSHHQSMWIDFVFVEFVDWNKTHTNRPTSNVNYLLIFGWEFYFSSTCWKIYRVSPES